MKTIENIDFQRDQFTKNTYCTSQLKTEANQNKSLQDNQVKD